MEITEITDDLPNVSNETKNEEQEKLKIEVGYLTNLDDKPLTIRRGTTGSAAYDIPCKIDNVATLILVDENNEPMLDENGEKKTIEKKCIIIDEKPVLIPTGLKLILNPGFHGILMSRSSTLLKRNIKVETGLIDSDYKGEIFIQVSSLNKSIICDGDAIAQLIIHKNFNLDLEEKPLKEVRGEGGFGSTSN